MQTAFGRRTTGGEIARDTAAGSSTGPGYRPLTRVALLPLRPDGRIALLRRPDGPHRGRPDLVGGRLEPAEWLAAAARREAREALGIQVAERDVEFSGLLHYRGEHGAGRLCVVFTTQHWSGSPGNAVPGRRDEVVWADPGGPPADTLPLARAVLDQHVAGTLHGTLTLPPADPGNDP
ncbi:NUDIX domain-containing protein [Streptomyces sp. NPDC054854]